MNEQSVPMLKPDVIWRVLDDGAVIVTPRGGNVRVLNRVGTAIWQLMDGSRSVADIEAQLIRTYDVPVEQARRDLHEFIRELEKRDMIAWKQESG